MGAGADERDRGRVLTSELNFKEIKVNTVTVHAYSSIGMPK